MTTFATVYGITDRAAIPNLRAILRDFLARQRQRRQIIRELTGHTDRQLADMGVTRSDIPAIAAGRFRR